MRNNRNYLTKEEHNARLAIFKQNLDMVRSHDPVATGYKIGINKFSDLSVEEFEKMQGFREIKDMGIDKFLGDDDEEEEETFMDEDCAEHCKAKGIECTHKKNETTAELEDQSGHGRGL